MLHTDITVRGYHCDAYGHVNNARYLELYEEARWNFLQPILDDGTIERLGVLFVVVNINVSYKRPIIPNDHVRVLIEGVSFNNSSLIIDQSISKGGEICSKAQVNFVLLDKELNRPLKITSEIQDIFNMLVSKA